MLKADRILRDDRQQDPQISIANTHVFRKFRIHASSLYLDYYLMVKRKRLLRSPVTLYQNESGMRICFSGVQSVVELLVLDILLRDPTAGS